MSENISKSDVLTEAIKLTKAGIPKNLSGTEYRREYYKKYYAQEDKHARLRERQKEYYERNKERLSAKYREAYKKKKEARVAHDHALTQGKLNAQKET